MTKTLLSVERLGISISGLSLTQNITVAIAAGERAGMVGESGCGKTSIAELLDIALPPASSTARLPAPPAPLPGCEFRPRCPRAFAPCKAGVPTAHRTGPGHIANCQLLRT